MAEQEEQDEGAEPALQITAEDAPAPDAPIGDDRAADLWARAIGRYDLVASGPPPSDRGGNGLVGRPASAQPSVPVPLMSSNAASRKRGQLTGSAAVLDMGEIRGRVGVRSVVTLRLPMRVEDRLQVKVYLDSTVPGLMLSDYRGSGLAIALTVVVDSRRSGNGIFLVRAVTPELTVEGEGCVTIEGADATSLNLTAPLGHRTSIAVPIVDELWEGEEFEAWWDPPVAQLWVDRDRGVVPEAVREFPFRVHFAPKDTRPAESTLVISGAKVELSVRVRGTCSGFRTPSWARRAV